MINKNESIYIQSYVCQANENKPEFFRACLIVIYYLALVG